MRTADPLQTLLAYKGIKGAKLVKLQQPATSCPRTQPGHIGHVTRNVSDAHENVNTCREKKRKREGKVEGKQRDGWRKGWKKWRAIGDTMLEDKSWTKKIDGSGVKELEKGNKQRQRKRRDKKVSKDRIVPKGVKYENEKK